MMIYKIKKRSHFLFCLILLFISFSSFSQMGWWTWMKGVNNTNSPANFGTIGVPAPTNNPPGLYQAATWTDLQGRFWVFGGYGSSNPNGKYSALWMYNPATNMWTWVKGPSTINDLGVYGVKGVPNIANNPSCRVFGIITWVDAAGDLWMFGGMGRSSTLANGALNDLWRYNIASNTWTWMSGSGYNVINSTGSYGVQGVPSPTNVPPARSETTAGWVDNNGNFWLFGGTLISFGNLNDLWKYNPTTNQWTWMKGANTGNNAGIYGTQGVPAPANNPKSRWDCAHWKDVNGNLWIFGGARTNAKFYNDLWRYNVSTNQWTWMRGVNADDPLPAFGIQCTPSINDPQGKYEMVSWTDSCGIFWMFGGDNSGTAIQNDLWSYNVTTNQWTWVNGNAPASNGTIGVPAATNMPEPRNGSMGFIYNRDLWIFGGKNQAGSGEVNDIWRYVIDTNCVPSCYPPLPTNPTANFSGINLIGCASLTVNFTNTSLNTNAWTWDFGDSSPTSNAQNPSHTYATPGQFTVTLIATDGVTSDTTSFTNYVTAVAPAVAAFSVSNDTICLGQSVTFTNSSTNATSYLWMFGDGAKDTAANPTYTYTTTGIFTDTLYAQNQYGCNDTITSTIVVGGVQATAGAALNLGCTASSGFVTVSTSTPGVTYNWSGPGILSGATNDSAVVNAAGTYTVIITDPASGCTNSATVNVTNNGSVPTITAGNPLVLSCTTSSGIISATSSSTGLNYSWQGPGIVSGGTTDTATVNAAGTYTVTVTDPANGCTNTTTVTVTSNIVNPNVTPGNPITISCTVSSGTISASSTTPGVTYNWQGAGIVSGGTTSSPIVNMPGTYTVTVTDSSNGCTATGTVSVTSNGTPPNIGGGGSLTLPCNPAIGTISASSTTSGVTYNWQGSGIVSGGSTSNPTVNATGTYTVTVTDPSTGCTSTSTVLVSSSPMPTAGVSSDVTITLGDNTTLTATGGGTYTWSPSTGLSTVSGNTTIASPTITTTYCVEVTDSNGCMDTACVTVTVEKPCAKEGNLGIPNAFSPNGDGMNDEFCLQGWDDCIELFSIKIYDRWGEKVYESRNSDFCWDGTYRGKPMDAQVLVYRIEAIFFHQKKLIVKNGNISLIR